MEDQWTKMIENIDKNLDGKITMNEFKRIFFNPPAKPVEKQSKK